MRRFRLPLVSAFCFVLGLNAVLAADGDQPFRIGVLDDLSSLFADQQGPGDVVAAKMAAEDFGGQVLGRPIEILSADHQNKPDTGLLTARQWYDRDNVQAIAGLGHSGVALAVQQLGIWDRHQFGPPILRNAQASLLCNVHDTLSYAGHTIFAGRVIDVRVADAIDTLLYQNGSFAAARPI